MKAWCHVSPSDPCAICSRPAWCTVSADGAWALCRRVDNGTGVHRVDRAGADYWLYRLDGHALCRHPAIELPSPPHAERAETPILDGVYRALLGALALSSTHRQALRHRGLADVEILRRGYRTLPRHGRPALARRLVDRCGPEVCATIPGVY